ncbi:unnamed protein product [Paramecium sonneborni]|uniref:Uncharacterized protein n=1 Tax=Paramecium sonneborni TaxID=65129 RepID=A0A8S1R955_9CILI|nr:unnamed protein product [Paramecium sonneborni]
MMLFIQYVSRQMELLQLQVVGITQSIYGILKHDNKKPNQMVILVSLLQCVSHQMELLYFQVVMISQFVYGIVKHDNIMPNQMVIMIKKFLV